MRSFLAAMIKRLLCKHQWVLVGIEWDGASAIRCRNCGKERAISL